MLPTLFWTSYTNPLGAATVATVIVKIVAVVPVVGATFTGTFTDATIDGWIVQWYG